jgi:hypothetical protein
MAFRCVDGWTTFHVPADAHGGCLYLGSWAITVHVEVSG